MIGIDLGTAYAKAARFNLQTKVAEVVPDPNGELRIPAVAYFGPSEVVVGASALRLAAEEGGRARVVYGPKRLFGQLTPVPLVDRKVDPAGVAAEVLRHLLANAAEVIQGPVRRAVVTHPADFTPAELATLQDAARRAGLEEASLLAESAAAVVGYEQTGRKAGDNVLVCDLGAGRFTAAVLIRTEDGSFRPVSPPRTRRVGGDDFDRLLSCLCERQTQERHEQPPGPATDAAFLGYRGCKEELSRRDETEIVGRLTDGAEFHWRVSRPVFEELIRAEVEEMASLARAAYDEAAGRHPPAETVLLVGGSSRIPLVRSLLSAALPVAPARWPQQDLAVALGAGRTAFALWGDGGPVPRVRVEQTTTLAELIHRVSEHEAEEEARMSEQNELKRDGARKKVLDTFVVKAAAMDQEYTRLRGVLADRLAQRDYLQAQDAVCALRKLREEDPEVTKAQTFLDTRCNKIGEVRSIAIGTYVHSVAVTTDGKFAWIARYDSHVSQCDLAAGTVTKNLSGHSNYVYAVTLDRSQKKLASGGYDQTVRIWDITEFKQITSWNHGGVVKSVVCMPDGKHLASAGDDSKIRLWNTDATTTPVVTFEGHTAPVLSLHTAPDGKFLVSASTDGSVRVWEIGRGRESRKMLRHRGEVYCVRFFPGGRLVVSGGQDTTLRVWDAETGREMARWEGHEGPVRCVDITPDGRYAVSAGDDKTVRVWDIASGWELRKFTGHGNVINCISVTPDGKHAVTGSTDSTLRIWALGACE
jgi:actin-like ATPase involved in cell morphogenesis